MKPKLLLLHGAIGAADQFASLQNELSHEFEIHTLNFSGHGRNEMIDSFSINTFANDVIKYLDTNAIASIPVFGYSMGGYVALYISLHFPGRIERIFTFATKFLWTPEIAQKEIKLLDAEKIAEKVPAFARSLEARHGKDWKIVLARTSEMMIGLGNHPALTDEALHKIEVRVLIGVGDKDQMVGLEETLHVYRQLKNASFMVLPDTVHPLEKIDVKRISEQIDYFFKTA